MGTGLSFNEEARAAFIAQKLVARGYGVLWDPKECPHVVMTSASQSEVREVSKKFKGVDNEWYKLEKIDVGGTKKNPEY